MFCECYSPMCKVKMHEVGSCVLDIALVLLLLLVIENISCKFNINCLT